MVFILAVDGVGALAARAFSHCAWRFPFPFLFISFFSIVYVYALLFLLLLFVVLLARWRMALLRL